MTQQREITNIVVPVDLQYDFFYSLGGHSGALGVSGADENFAAECREFLNERNLRSPNGREDSLIIATQDFHPSGHISFGSTHNQPPFSLYELPDGRHQVMWPDHCVQGTKGAEMASEIFDGINIDQVFQKGTEIHTDSYGGILSDISPNGSRIPTGMGEFLASVLNGADDRFDSNIQVIEVFGLAFDYCVGFTALQIKSVVDSLELNVPVIVFKDLCRSVAQESEESMSQQLTAAGISII